MLTRYLTIQTKGSKYAIDPITTGVKIIVESVLEGHPGA